MKITANDSKRTNVALLAAHCRSALVAAYTTQAIFLLAGATRHAGIEAVAALAFVAAFLHWCTLDASIHGKTFPHGLAFPFLMTWPISTAFYLVWTRGRRNGLMWYARAIAFAALALVGILAVGLLLTARAQR